MANYKILKLAAVPEDVAKTSQPCSWRQPRGPKIKGTEIQNVSVVGYNSMSSVHGAEERRHVSSTLFNPLRGEFPQMVDLKNRLTDINIKALILPVLEQTTEAVNTKYGVFPKGSILAVQQPLHSTYHITIFDGVDFPQLPYNNTIVNNYNYALDQNKYVNFEGLSLSLEEIHNFEEQTRLQSDSPLWHKLRKHRITASKMHGIYIRQKDHESLLN